MMVLIAMIVSMARAISHDGLNNQDGHDVQNDFDGHDNHSDPNGHNKVNAINSACAAGTRASHQEDGGWSLKD